MGPGTVVQIDLEIGRQVALGKGSQVTRVAGGLAQRWHGPQQPGPLVIEDVKRLERDLHLVPLVIPNEDRSGGHDRLSGSISAAGADPRRLDVRQSPAQEQSEDEQQDVGDASTRQHGGALLTVTQDHAAGPALAATRRHCAADQGERPVQPRASVSENAVPNSLACRPAAIGFVCAAARAANRRLTVCKHKSYIRHEIGFDRRDSLREMMKEPPRPTMLLHFGSVVHPSMVHSPRPIHRPPNCQRSMGPRRASHLIYTPSFSFGGPPQESSIEKEVRAPSEEWYREAWAPRYTCVQKNRSHHDALQIEDPERRSAGLWPHA